MERVSRAIEDNPGQFTKDKLTSVVTGKKESLRHAIELLEREEYVAKARHERWYYYTTIKPYRPTDDPKSEQFSPMRNVLPHSNAAEEGVMRNDQ